MLESRQTSHHEGKIICPRNQKAEIEQFEQSLPCCGLAIRKDDPANHLDRLIAAGDGGKTPGIIVPLELARAEKMQHTI